MKRRDLHKGQPRARAENSPKTFMCGCSICSGDSREASGAGIRTDGLYDTHHKSKSRVQGFMYDEAFRRQAAATGLTEWSKINPSIFTVCFNTRARSGTRCELCLTLGHDAEGCTRSEGEGDLALR